jgi:hypothetical protein
MALRLFSVSGSKAHPIEKWQAEKWNPLFSTCHFSVCHFSV